jgi:hypothetical protein
MASELGPQLIPAPRYASNDHIFQGLWIWNKPIEVDRNGETYKVFVIDSEGIGAFNED